MLARLGDLAVDPADPQELRDAKRLQTLMAWASVVPIGLMGASYVALGYPHLAALPWAYCLATLGMLAWLAARRDHAAFSWLHPALVVVMPWIFHLRLGGFFGSGGVVLWSLVGLVAALMFLGPRRSLAWFAWVMLLVALAGLREGPLAPRSIELPRHLVAGYFVFNTLGFTAFTYLGARWFSERLAAEHQRAAGLLLAILPRPVAERLKRGPEVIADRAEAVSVVFSDLVGFTTLSSRVAPEDLVRLLDAVFGELDALTERFGVEKVKTIGDAYMAVSGLPEPRPDHAQAAARLALCMVETVPEVGRRFGVDLSVRVGIHSGPVVAGVIGTRKFAYDLWGDTVNLASRMESHGEPGRIQVSDATARLLEGSFELEARGSIQVKGKGTMETRWLLGERPPSPAFPGRPA